MARCWCSNSKRAGQTRAMIDSYTSTSTPCARCFPGPTSKDGLSTNLENAVIRNPECERVPGWWEKFTAHPTQLCDFSRTSGTTITYQEDTYPLFAEEGTEKVRDRSK